MKLATIETITNLTPIPNADRIELAHVQGWVSVVKRGDYKVGEAVVFVPIDTQIQPANWNAFLHDKKDPAKLIRVRTVKLRGQVSQGLIFPLSILPANVTPFYGEDVAHLIGVTKYEKQIPVQLRGLMKGDFPSQIISKTDEDNLLSNVVVLNELKSAHTVECTCKVDGTSVTFLLDTDGELTVCSRNMNLQCTEGSVYWKIAIEYRIKEILTANPGFAIQGEIAGPGIQDNNAGLNNIQLFVFNVKNLETGRYYNIEQSSKLFPNLPFVKVVKIFTNAEFEDQTTEKLQQLTNDQKYTNNAPAEGIVLRGINQDGEVMYSRRLQKMLSVKIINQNFTD